MPLERNDSMMNWLEDVSDTFKDWILVHGSNPLLWIFLFFLGILVFWVTYKALTRHH